MAGFVRKMFGKMFGGREEPNVQVEERIRVPEGEGIPEEGGSGNGFRVKKAVRNVEQPVPVVREVHEGQGGVQGLSWYSKRLKMDEDDDVAEEFLCEVVPQVPGGSSREQLSPQLETVRERGLRTVRPHGPISVADGNVHQSVEAVGRRVQ